jgi:hypothetical protein
VIAPYVTVRLCHLWFYQGIYTYVFGSPLAHVFGRHPKTNAPLSAEVQAPKDDKDAPKDGLKDGRTFQQVGAKTTKASGVNTRAREARGRRACRCGRAIRVG